MKLVVIFPAATLILIILAIVSIFLLTANTRQSTNIPPLNPNYKLSYSGSIGFGPEKIDSGIASFKKNYRKLDELTLYWYDLSSESGISRDDYVTDKMEEDIITLAKQNEIEILVGLGDHGDADKADEILTDPKKQKEHITKVVSLIIDKEFDGIIIDYEDLRDDQEKDFTKYMSKLSEEMGSKGKSLGISVPIETEGRVFHGINIVDVSKSVDKMYLVTYEEFSEETGPGPIASIDWVDTILNNVVKQGVDPKKIVLGTSHSGNDWISDLDEEFYSDTTTKEALNISSENSVGVKWDEKTQSSFFEYKDDSGNEHIVWLEDSNSFKAKIDLAQSYEILGVYIWYLGGEDPLIWKDN